VKCIVVELFETETKGTANRNAFLGAPVSKPKVAEAIFLLSSLLPTTHIAQTASLRTACGQNTYRD
jgi:hypothetical protein